METDPVGVWHVTAIPHPDVALCRYLIESTIDTGDGRQFPPSETIDRNAVVADLEAWLDSLEPR